MPTVQTDIQIDAPPERVWAVLTDFGDRTWDPFFTRLDGTPRPGETLTVTPAAGMTFRPRVLVADRPRELSRLGRLLVPGLFDGRHEFLLHASDGRRDPARPPRTVPRPADGVRRPDVHRHPCRLRCIQPGAQASGGAGRPPFLIHHIGGDPMDRTTIRTAPAPGPVPTRAAAPLLAAAGALFAVYPILRPYTDETTLAGAAAMASPAWAIAHLCAMAGFVLIPVGLLGVHGALSGSAGERPAGFAVVASWIGACLVLPYYGAETFGLGALGEQVVRTGDTGLLAAAEVMRLGPAPASLFLGGFALLAVAGILTAVAVARTTAVARWAGVPLAAGLLLFLPQFFAAPGLRIAHGLLMAAGCGAVAWAVARRGTPVIAA